MFRSIHQTWDITSGEDSISQAMSQVSIKALEITGLRKQNKDLMDMDELKEEIRKKMEDHCKELEDKNKKVAKQVSGQVSLQGEKNLI